MPRGLRVIGYFGQGDDRALDSVDVSIDVAHSTQSCPSPPEPRMRPTGRS